MLSCFWKHILLAAFTSGTLLSQGQGRGVPDLTEQQTAALAQMASGIAEQVQSLITARMALFQPLELLHKSCKPPKSPNFGGLWAKIGVQGGGKSQFMREVYSSKSAVSEKSNSASPRASGWANDRACTCARSVGATSPMRGVNWRRMSLASLACSPSSLHF